MEALLFDLDGTLVETNIDFPLMKREVLRLASNAGLESANLKDLDILSIIEHAAQHLRASGSHELAEKFRSEANARLEEIEMRHAADAKEIPGAKQLIQTLRARGIRVGIVTRNCRKASELALRIVGIEPDVLISRDDCSSHKPSPDPIFRALEFLGVKPSAAAMVGDHLMDIQSGQNAGLTTVGFLREDRPENFFDQVRPNIVVRSLSEVMCAVIGDNR
ncbi:MAG: HAD-IA family hydrolase [Armatimonadota bacterium]|nr:HAD-IA family hydrolase [Armatimonadota bacterium]